MCMDKDMGINQAAKKLLSKTAIYKEKVKKILISFFIQLMALLTLKFGVRKRKMIMPNWNPKLEDLVATDWQLIKKESDPIKRALSKIIN